MSGDWLEEYRIRGGGPHAAKLPAHVKEWPTTWPLELDGVQVRFVRIDAYEQSAASVERMKKLLSECLDVLREPENGVHYCRGCDAGTHNAWHHSPGCRLESHGADVIRLKFKIRQELGLI